MGGEEEKNLGQKINFPTFILFLCAAGSNVAWGVEGFKRRHCSCLERSFYVQAFKAAGREMGLIT
jgi:hypothetical protein